jgi:hypothetical protein
VTTRRLNSLPTHGEPCSRGRELLNSRLLQQPVRARAASRWEAVSRRGRALGHRRDRHQNDRRGGDRHIQPMMFANRENIETRHVCKLRRREELRQALLGADRVASIGSLPIC